MGKSCRWGGLVGGDIRCLFTLFKSLSNRAIHLLIYIISEWFTEQEGGWGGCVTGSCALSF